MGRSRNEVLRVRLQHFGLVMMMMVGRNGRTKLLRLNCQVDSCAEVRPVYHGSGSIFGTVSVTFLLLEIGVGITSLSVAKVDKTLARALTE